MSFAIRTDLAVETQEILRTKEKELRGVNFREEKKEDMLISYVEIETENAASAMGKPRGKYITIEAPNMIEADFDYHKEISKELSNIITQLVEKVLPGKKNHHGYGISILIVGLGNREVTPDSLGPKVIDNLFITRHIIKEFGKYAFEDSDMNKISGIAPGVMAQTGMECAEILRGIVKEIKPDLVLTVDALAAGNARRLGRTIQLTDTGITPGSGVGNHRNAINRESIGVPVIALGVPTVVDAATLHAHNEMVPPFLNGMFVTPKNIDESVKQLSYTISEGLNMAFIGNDIV